MLQMTQKMGSKLSLQTGTSMVEVLVALCVMAIVVGQIAPSVAFHMHVNTQAERKTLAIAAAQQVLDELRFQDPTTLPNTGPGPTSDITMDGLVLKVTPYYCLNTALCSSNTVRHVTVRTTLYGIQLYETETVYTKLR